MQITVKLPKGYSNTREFTLTEEYVVRDHRGAILHTASTKKECVEYLQHWGTIVSLNG